MKTKQYVCGIDPFRKDNWWNRFLYRIGYYKTKPTLTIFKMSDDEIIAEYINQRNDNIEIDMEQMMKYYEGHCNSLGKFLNEVGYDTNKD